MLVESLALLSLTDIVRQLRRGACIDRFIPTVNVEPGF